MHKGVYIATPAYGNPNTDYLGSLCGLQALMLAEGWHVHIGNIGGLCYVHTARNLLVDAFLQTQCTEMLWIDSDIGFRPEEMLQLCKIEKNVVGAAAPYRSKEPGFPIVWHLDEEGHPIGEWLPDGKFLLQCQVVPTAVLRVQRGVFGKLVEAGEVDRVVDSGRIVEGKMRKVFRFFHFEEERKEDHVIEYGEDVTFCHKLSRTNIGIWCDPRLTIRHHGETYYSGCLAECFERPPEVLKNGSSEGLGVPGGAESALPAQAL